MFSRLPPRKPRATAAPRSNLERTQTTRTALLDAAHSLFVAHGFAGTSTPDICAAAGLTRGALYHHWTDKSDLLRAVLEREAAAVRAAIDDAASHATSAQDALRLGADAYLAAMAERGRTRLLLVEGPAVLGAAETAALDASHAAAALRQGLRAALRRDESFIAALSNLVSAAFDRAALDIDAGADPAATRKAMRWVIERLLAA